MKSFWRTVAATLGAVTVTAGISGCSDDSGPIEGGIVVNKVENLPQDFVAGVDVSTVLSLEESGVTFKDNNGKEADLFDVLKHNGVTHVRVRVWNDPFDAQGNGYGGGNVSPERAIEIGKRATDAGLKVLVDFHYSDFWADPAKQQAPKSWADMSDGDKAIAAGDFTQQMLVQMKDAGVDVAMVQTGNETNNGVAGVTAWNGMAAIFNAGAAATREVFPDALVAVHFTNPEQEGSYERIAKILDNFDVDYDVFASSYYPFWHGTPENLTAVLKSIADTYGKKVMVAETSWLRTLDDADGYPNVIGAAADATQYAISEQGQADAVRAVVQAVADVGDAGVGVFYWEPAWLPVGPPDQAEANAKLWEQFGSGWATSFAGSYDPNDAAGQVGGSAWDNQSLFAPDGTPLESLRIFEYVRRGATAPLAVSQIDSPQVKVQVGGVVELPATVTVHFNDGTSSEDEVAWQEIAVDTSREGVHEVSGTLASGDSVTATITVGPINVLVNPGFEDDDLSMWTLDSDAATFAVVDDNVPAAMDARVLNFWSDADYSLSVAQTVTGLEPGTYNVKVSVHGEDKDPAGVALALNAKGSQGEWTAPLQLNGWQQWYQGVIEGAVVGADGTLTVSVDGTLGAEDWGFIDGFIVEPVN
ncbi:glycosyl hydrolase 53 family protein [Demequina sp.]|uniref:glycosyl hydrolase 53 family protein n=1 Tax=Demequina sp. TaxID=2050685 RepID=UPI003D104DEF